MKKSNLMLGVLFLWVFCIFGCNNEDYGYKVEENKDINGSEYISGELHEANVFGVESPGLTSNPGKRPPNDYLGAGNNSYENVYIEVKPDYAESLINSTISFSMNAKILTKNELRNAEDADELAGNRLLWTTPPSGDQFVIERASITDTKGNAVLALDPDPAGQYELDIAKSSDVRLVVKNVNGPVYFHLVTGNVYSRVNPMYYINAWHRNGSDDNHGVSEVHVTKPLKLSECDECVEGTQVENDTTRPEGILSEIGSGLKNAQLKLLDTTPQDLFVGSKKTLSVMLTGNPCAKFNAESGECAKELPDKVCWTFIGKNEGNNDARITGSDPAAKKDDCVLLSNNEILTLTFDAGFAYKANYFINFFHATAETVTYRINTYVMPDVLGEQGDGPGVDLDGDTIPDAELGLGDAVPDDFYLTGQMSAEDSHKLLCENPPGSPLYFDTTIQTVIANVCGDAGCDANPADFQCRIVDNGDGTWVILGPDGFPVKYDLDGDGIPDPVKIVIEEQDGEYYYGGIDIDGDGVPDIAPDACIMPNPADTVACKNLNTEIWCGKSEDSAFSPTCTKIQSPINVNKDVYVLVTDIETVSSVQEGKLCYPRGKEYVCGTPKGNVDINGNLIRGSLKANNAKLVASDGKQVDSTDAFAGKDGLAKFEMWMGTAYDAVYYINVKGDRVKPARVPIEAIYYLDLPSVPGDEANYDDAIVPPDGMEPYNYDLGDITLRILSSKELSSPYDYVALESPVYRTLALRVQALKKGKTDKQGNPIPVKGAKVYWKLTRGPSPNNNATLTYKTGVTGSDGKVENMFYSGNAYDAVYYVTVFSPNALNDGVDKGKKNKGTGDYQFVTFKLTIKDFKGKIPSPDDDDVVVPDTPGVPVNSDDKCCLLAVNKTSGLPEEPAACYEPVTPEDTDVCTAPVSFSSVNGQATAPNLPQGSGCSEATVCAGISAEPMCTDKAKEDIFCPNCTYNEIRGCLALVAPPAITVAVGTQATINAQLTWDNGNGPQGIQSVVYADLRASQMAGAHMSQIKVNEVKDDNGVVKVITYRTIANNQGDASFTFVAGSAAGVYYVDIWHPNIHKVGTKIPRRIKVNVVDPTTTPMDPANRNLFNLSVSHSGDLDRLLKKRNESITEVRYYIMAGKQAGCGVQFALSNKNEMKSLCEKTRGQDDDKAVNYNVYNGCGLVGDPDEDKTDSYGRTNYPNSPYNSAKQLTFDAASTPRVNDVNMQMAIYAVGFHNETPVAYGCTDSVMFPMQPTGYMPGKCISPGDGAVEKGKCPTATVCENKYDLSEETDLCEKDNILKVKVVDVTIPLSNIPLSIANRYETTTMLDLRNFLVDDKGELPTTEECETHNSPGCIIRKIKDAYDKFLGDSPTIADMLFDKYVSMIVYYDGNKDRDSKSDSAKRCLKLFCKIDESTIDDVCTLSAEDELACEEMPDKKKAKCKKEKTYKECDTCKFCAKAYYYTTSKPYTYLTDVVESLLRSLLKDAINQTHLEDQLCTLLDGFQFIDLGGTIEFKDPSATNNLKGKVSFGKVTIFGLTIGVEFSGVTGVWSKAELSNSTVLNLQKMPLKFAYGELLYGLLAQWLGFADEEDGKPKLKKLIKCDKIFPNGINIPLIGGVSKEQMKNFCDSILDTADDHVVDLADSLAIDLNITMDGMAQFTRDGGYCSPAKDKSGCLYDQIEGGTWVGTGKLGDKPAKIEGFWSAKASGTSAEPPVAKADAETYKYEHSICRYILNHEAQQAPPILKSNKECLGGSYDDIANRATKNKCSNSTCQPKNNKSIVVCDDNGKLNADFAAANAYAIIQAANIECAGSTNDYCKPDSDKHNPEIAGNGDTYSNMECYKDNCKPDKCHNATIYVCEKDDNGWHKLSNDDLAEALGCSTVTQGLCPATPAGTACTIDNSGNFCTDTTAAIKKKVTEDCKEQCESAMCIDNLDWDGTWGDGQACESHKEIVIATWDSFEKMTSPDNGSKAADLSIVLADAKMDIGTDGKDSALAVVGDCGTKLEIQRGAAGYQITRVTFKVYGDDRMITVNPGNESVKAASGDWKKFEVSGYCSGNSLVIVESSFDSGMNTDPTAYSALKFDEIKVYGYKLAEGETAGAGKTCSATGITCSGGGSGSGSSSNGTLAEGEECDENSECVSGLKCLVMDDGKKQCTSKIETGASCDKHDKCISGRCAEGTCSDKLPNEEVCSEHADCKSGRCDSVEEICKDKLDENGKCTENADCKSDNCDKGACAASSGTGTDSGSEQEGKPNQT